MIINTNKTFSRLNISADSSEELETACNMLYNRALTDDVRTVRDGQTSVTLRSSKKRFVRGLLVAKRAELRDVLGQSPKMSRVCVEVAHFIRDAVVIS